MSENFRGELYGEGFTVHVRDFIVREDHIAFEFLVKEPGYGDYKVEGKAREYTQGTFAGQHAAVVEYDIQEDKNNHKYATLVFELECPGTMAVTGEWRESGESYDFNGELDPINGGETCTG